MKIRITGLKKFQTAGQTGLNLTPITGTGAFNWANPLATETPALKKTVIKADGTQETTGTVGDGYTLFEQSTAPTTAVSNSTVPITAAPVPEKKKLGQEFVKTLGMGYVAGKLYDAAFNQGDAERERDAMVRNRNAQYNQQGESFMDRGNYGVGPSDYGLFRPNQMGVKSPEGQYNGGRFFQLGGSNAETEQYMVNSIDANTPLVNPMDFLEQQQQMMPMPPQEIATPPVQPMEVNIKAAPVALKEQIALRESGGNYKALPKKKDGSLASSAAGKYQFLWNSHRNKITELTGVKSKQEFLNTPEAQEKYFDYWNSTTLTPYAQKIKQQFNPKQSMDQLKMMIHFAGPQGAMDYFAKGTVTRDAFGTTNASYTGRMEAGGEYELTADQIMQIKAMGGDVEFI